MFSVARSFARFDFAALLIKVLFIIFHFFHHNILLAYTSPVRLSSVLPLIPYLFHFYFPYKSKGYKLFGTFWKKNGKY
jgi:hypothetical protein